MREKNQPSCWCPSFHGTFVDALVAAAAIGNLRTLVGVTEVLGTILTQRQAPKPSHGHSTHGA